MTELKNLAAALVAATAEVRAVEKRGDNTHDRYMYATADDVVRAATAALQAHGLTVVPTESRIISREQTIKGATFTSLILERCFRVLHTSGEFIEASMSWPIVTRAADAGKGAAAAETTCYSYYLKTLLDMSRDPNDDIDKDRGGANGGDPAASAMPMASPRGAKLVAQIRGIDSSERFKQAEKHLSGLVTARDEGLQTVYTDADLGLAMAELEKKRC